MLSLRARATKGCSRTIRRALGARQCNAEPWSSAAVRRSRSESSGRGRIHILVQPAFASEHSLHRWCCARRDWQPSSRHHRCEPSLIRRETSVFGSGEASAVASMRPEKKSNFTLSQPAALRLVAKISCWCPRPGAPPGADLAPPLPPLPPPGVEAAAEGGVTSGVAGAKRPIDAVDGAEVEVEAKRPA